jgi:hypothetical protein
MQTLQLFSLATALFVATPAFAHHPFDSEYDRTKTVSLNGTVDHVEWARPHVNVHLDVKEGPNAGMWVVELGSPQELMKAGWKANQFEKGDKVSVEGWMAKDGAKRANAKSIMTADGTTLSAASSYNAPATDIAANRQTEAVGTSGQAQQLPATASPLPLAGLAGLLAFGAGLALRARRS